MQQVAVSPAPQQTAPRAAGPELPRANRVIHIPHFELDEKLTSEQVDFLETYGFIRFKNFVPRAKARSLYESVLEVDKKIIASGKEKINGVPLIFGKRADGSRYVQRIPFTSMQSPDFSEFLKDRRFRGIIET